MTQQSHPRPHLALNPSQLRALNPTQSRLTDLAVALGQHLDSVQANTPHQLRDMHLNQGHVGYARAAELLGQMGNPPTTRADLRDAQIALDAALSPQDIRAFWQGLPWAQFTFQAHAGIWAVLAPWGELGQWLAELGYGSAPLHTYPSYSDHSELCNLSGQALLTAVDDADLLDRINPIVPRRITLTEDAQRDLMEVNGVTYWRFTRPRRETWHAVTPLGETVQYIDADDAPDRPDHDGNGWHVPATEYLVHPTPDEAPRQAIRKWAASEQRDDVVPSPQEIEPATM